MKKRLESLPTQRKKKKPLKVKMIMRVRRKLVLRGKSYPNDTSEKATGREVNAKVNIDTIIVKRRKTVICSNTSKKYTRAKNQKISSLG